MDMPKDPVMLLSFINTQLRDKYSSLDQLVAAYMVDKKYIIDKLAAIDYKYDSDLNKFV